MKKVLLLTSSLFAENGQSSAMAAMLKAELQAQGKDVSVTEKDLVALDLPHLGAEEMGAWMTPVDERSEAQQALAQRSDLLIEELMAHDVIVLAAPLYNLGIPSQVKAYFDRLLRAGVTFKYTAEGPKGLVEGKQALVLAARGGIYAGSEADSQTPHIKTMFGLMGVSDLTFVYAEGLAVGPQMKEEALSAARAQIQAYVAEQI
ncbi:NAD(P)H-dependent oxidoreductase [Gallaecimonas sp. GXIMD4217]|uniref:FMN-dependent NADH-azoreductase n=1 Tax=Gallaecimonas sp. GXIMD4217 TaxID=3131927 RepID=UPI00311B21F6